MSLVSNLSEQQQSEQQVLINRLESIIKQCHNRFVNRYELATENDQLIINLLSIIEEILSNGLLKNKPNKILGRRNKLLNNILSKTNINDDTNLYFWNYITLFLTEHELKRFLSLRNVYTDLGRGRSWIRNCLNEHSLEKYFLMIIEDDQYNKQQFYNDWALLLSSLFKNRLKLLPSLFKSLNSILFALNIDHVDLDLSSSSSLISSSTSLAPIRKNEENNLLVKSMKKKSNLIIIKDEDHDNVDKKGNNNDEDDDDDDECIDTENSVACIARSAPVTSFLTPSPITQESLTNKSDIIDTNIQRSSSLLSVNDIEPPKLVLYPISDDIDVVPTSSTLIDNSVANENNLIKNHSNDNYSLLNEKIDNLQKICDRLTKENDLLNVQMKKYIATIELLKYNNNQQQQQPLNETYQQQQQSSNYNKNDSNNLNCTIEDYQKKLVQVSEMHGEIVEFNEHLYKVIQIKDTIIARLKNELIELRGPLPDQDEVLSISTELESNTHSLQSLPQPLIHVWIPTAFLSGGFKGKSHHIYQIYIRIKDEEWNVYRRYSQFYSLYRSLKNQYPTTAKFEFPPKKAIGNKDSRVVQERRKKLEYYLRNVINHIQLQHIDINNKETFTNILPFLSDKHFLQDHRTQSQSNINQQPQQQQQRQQQQRNQRQQQQQQQSSNQRNYLGF